MIPQLERAVLVGQKTFPRSPGDQVRDLLPVETVAEYLVETSFRRAIDGVINSYSGKPVSVRDFVERYLRSRGYQLELAASASAETWCSMPTRACCVTEPPNPASEERLKSGHFG